MKKNISIIVFWGAVWGLEEATLGHFLHMIPVSIGWLLWFPLAYYFINKVYKQTGRLSSILYASSIAASIKFIDLLMPIRIDRIVNPAASILLEGLAVFAVLFLSQRSKNILRYKIAEALTASLSWRVLYLLYILTLPNWIVSISPWSGTIPFIKFLLMESTVNGLMIYIFIKAAGSIKKIDIRSNSFYKIINSKTANSKALGNSVFKTAAALALFALAVYVQWAF